MLVTCKYSNVECFLGDALLLTTTTKVLNGIIVEYLLIFQNKENLGNISITDRIDGVRMRPMKLFPLKHFPLHRSYRGDE